MKTCTAGSVITRQELGYKRCFWSMRIYEHLKRHGMSASTIAHGLGITSQAVSQTINGKRHSPRVLDALRAAGVPEKYLFDPRRMERAGKEAA